MNNLSFNSLDDVAASQLETKFMEYEIYDCLKNCDGDKASALDNFI